MNVGTNGFGRIGRLAVRALREHPELHLTHVNEIKGGLECAAHLLDFDTVHGRFPGEVAVEGDGIRVDDRVASFSAHQDPRDIPWAELDVDIVLECSGQWRTIETLTPHLKAGAQRVIVAAPVKGGVPNIVMGCNEDSYDPAVDQILTAASCTTNCLAPVVKVIHESFGIEHGVITTIHNATNTQVVVDAPHRDLRRARSALNALIPSFCKSVSSSSFISVTTFTMSDAVPAKGRCLAARASRADTTSTVCFVVRLRCVCFLFLLFVFVSLYRPR